MSIKSFLDYKYLLQEKYKEYNYILFFKTINTRHNILEINLSIGKKEHVCIPRSFLVVNVCNLGKTFCSPCILE